LSQFCSSVNTH